MVVIASGVGSTKTALSAFGIIATKIMMCCSVEDHHCFFGNNATSDNLGSDPKVFRDRTVIVLGHGDIDGSCIKCHFDRPAIHSDNIAMFNRSSCFVSIACYSAKVLGREIASFGRTHFIGFDDLFYVLTQVKKDGTKKPSIGFEDIIIDSHNNKQDSNSLASFISMKLRKDLRDLESWLYVKYQKKIKIAMKKVNIDGAEHQLEFDDALNIKNYGNFRLTKSEIMKLWVFSNNSYHFRSIPPSGSRDAVDPRMKSLLFDKSDIMQ